MPESRLSAANREPVREGGSFVLYWMIAARRLERNFALQRAVDWARRLGRPLLVLEALRSDYPWASDRLHRFALDGMREHRDRLRGSRVGYHPYVEPAAGAGKGLLAALAAHASVVVTDLFPSFFLPRMVAAAARRIRTRLEVVDSNGLLPLAATRSEFGTAYAFRRFLQGQLPAHLLESPAVHPLRGHPIPRFGKMPDGIARRWPPASDALLDGDAGTLAALPIDHEVPPVAYGGGERPAREALARFVDERLPAYAERRNDPDAGVTSGLSPYLHWGHLSVHAVFDAVAEREGWSPARIGAGRDGSREGWWGMSPEAEAFLDQLVTWRELGFVFAYHRPDHAEYESLPAWARETLEAHASDERPHLYTRTELEGAGTQDELWNAAQRELLREGRIHNYMRMLWGKKILEWSPDPRSALRTMVALNDRWAVDGRDPNSYGGIAWVMGRFDRGWPERPVFGKVRSMSSTSTRRKVEVERYLRIYAP